MAHLSLHSHQSWTSLKLMMGTLWKGLVLCLFVGDFIAAQYARRYRDTAFPPDLSRFFENFMPFQLEQRAGFMSYDRTPEMNMFAGLPPIMDVPRVEVFCDDSKLTVVVDKRSFGHSLTREEMQLGDGCYSNGELPDKFVFSYNLDQCGTTHVMQDGRNIFTNSLHLNFKKASARWWQTLPTIHISCMTLRSNYPNIPWTPPESGRSVNIRPMTLSWSHSAESNLYERGQVVNLQVSASIRPDQQLFVQSCFVSASPEPQTRPRHAVILNKGCATPVGSPHPIVHFMASDRTNVVNFVLNTSHLISELYIHCSVLVSNLGVTHGSKSCNYNVIRSRWEELNGEEKVCDCCSSKCEGLSVKTLPGTKVIVGTGPFIIVDEDNQSVAHPNHEPQEMIPEPIPNHTETEIPNPAEDVILSGASVMQCKPSSPKEGVVVVSQNRGGRRTLWLPGQDGKDCDSPPQEVSTLDLQRRGVVLIDAPELQTPTTQQEPHLTLPTNELEGSAYKWDTNSLTMVNGWPIFPQPDIAIIAEEFKRDGMMDPVKVKAEMVQDDNFLPTEVGLNVVLVEDLSSPKSDDVSSKKSQRKRRFPHDVEVNHNQDSKMTDKLVGMQLDDHTNMDSIVRAKIEFSKGVDGSKKLRFEEEVSRQRVSKGVTRRFGRNVMKRREPGLKGLRSTFLSLFRTMDKSE